MSIDYDNFNFNTYELENHLIVEDTFYIGFKQFESNFLAVGLDKNNNTSDKIFYKIDNQWEQNDIIKLLIKENSKFDWSCSCHLLYTYCFYFAS